MVLNCMALLHTQGNLSFDIDDDILREHFESCGEIKQIRWVERNGQFKYDSNRLFDVLLLSCSVDTHGLTFATRMFTWHL